MSLRGGADDEAISFSGKDCFAEFILSLSKGSQGPSGYLTAHEVLSRNPKVRSLQSGFPLSLPLNEFLDRFHRRDRQLNIKEMARIGQDC